MLPRSLRSGCVNLASADAAASVDFDSSILLGTLPQLPLVCTGTGNKSHCPHLSSASRNSVCPFFPHGRDNSVGSRDGCGELVQDSGRPVGLIVHHGLLPV